MSENILIHTEGPVMEIRFHRPEKKNSVTGAMYKALHQGLADAAREDAVRAVVIRGSDDCFCAGNDIADLAAAGSGQGASAAGDFMESLATFPKPLLAAVSGPAIGIGATLLPQCDLVYADESAYFVTPFTTLGVCPEAGSSFSLAACIGPRRAAEMLLLGEKLDARQALEAGLINAIFPPRELYRETAETAKRLASLSAVSVRTTKQLMRHEFAGSSQEAFAREIRGFAELLSSEEAQQAFAAFLGGDAKS